MVSVKVTGDWGLDAKPLKRHVYGGVLTIIGTMCSEKLFREK
ncbi:hypothetical protein [Nostoc sp.]